MSLQIRNVEEERQRDAYAGDAKNKTNTYTENEAFHEHHFLKLR